MNKTTSITEIVSIRTLEKIQDNFSNATGIGCVMRALNGELVTKFSRPSRLWLEVTKNPEREKQYEPILLAGLDRSLKTGQVQIIQRYMDTFAFIVPIGIDGRIEAFLIGGLVRYGNPVIVNCAKEADRLGMDLDTFLEMYLELTFVTPQKLEASANMFKIIAQSISSLAKEGNEAKNKVNRMESINDTLEKEVKLTSLELKESEERYRRLFNTINDGVYITDMEGRIKDINQAGAKMMGYTREELIGSNMRDVYVNPADRDEFLTMIMSKGHVEGFNPHVQIKNGVTKHFETNSTLIKNQAGKAIGIQGIFRDISKRPRVITKPNQPDVSPRTNIPSAKDNQSAY